MTPGKGGHSRDQKLKSHQNKIFIPVKNKVEITYRTWEFNHQDQSRTLKC